MADFARGNKQKKAYYEPLGKLWVDEWQSRFESIFGMR